MLLKLFLLFTFVPLAELTILYYVAQYTSLPITLALIVFTGAVGAVLTRWQGWRAAIRVRSELAHGRIPGDPLLDGILILVAGALLITPGILTDVFGFGLLTPPFCAVIKRRLTARFKNRFQFGGSVSGSSTTAVRDTVIDVKVVDPADEEDDQGL